jgi:hypothetical protein
VDDFAALQRRVSELEAALKRERARTEHERRRADLLERSTRQAWHLSTYRRPSVWAGGEVIAVCVLKIDGGRVSGS